MIVSGASHSHENDWFVRAPVSACVSKFSDRYRRIGQLGNVKLGCLVIVLLAAGVLYVS